MATLWIIDGYNFIRNSDRFSHWEAQDPDEGKKAALAWLAGFQDLTGQSVCVVFDAYSGLHREPIKKSISGIQIIESRGGYTADEEIISLAQQKKEGAVVVSSDREVLTGAIKAGSSILTSQEFEREVGKIFHRVEEEGEYPQNRSSKGMNFRPPKEKKKAYQILRKYQ